MINETNKARMRRAIGLAGIIAVLAGPYLALRDRPRRQAPVLPRAVGWPLPPN
jgi:hypothetical protein